MIRSLAAVVAVLLSLSTSAAAEECLDCHELAAISPGGTVVHPPFGEKECGSCHADHGDQERLMLTEKGNALCAQCHEFAAPAFLEAHRRIAPTDKAPCIGCHDPHRSPNKRLLRSELHAPVKAGTCEKCHRSDGKLRIPLNRDFCFLCHERAAFARPVVHEPVKMARCLDCHDPHGGGRVRLLKGGYTLEREVQHGDKDYAFCLSCHEPSRLLVGTGGDRTRFSDGERNLHALHVLAQGRRSEKVSGEKGLTCRNCHEAHSASTAALTRTELDCGASLCMKMEFRRAEDGGECMASCHGEKIRYRRAAAPATPPPGP
ncbi:MAG: cytochrome c3 family protein [Candidatus Methylomirabilia bacterium]